ncbi:MAG: hypothetical protein COB15_05890 [Flavobacteriales bacterium]|nr:MAG: hypothetical protein COB15_05890 [Flavobacteriales bacterium]
MTCTLVISRSEIIRGNIKKDNLYSKNFKPKFKLSVYKSEKTCNKNNPRKAITHALENCPFSLKLIFSLNRSFRNTQVITNRPIAILEILKDKGKVTLTRNKASCILLSIYNLSLSNFF